MSHAPSPPRPPRKMDKMAEVCDVGSRNGAACADKGGLRQPQPPPFAPAAGALPTLRPPNEPTPSAAASPASRETPRLASERAPGLYKGRDPIHATTWPLPYPPAPYHTRGPHLQAPSHRRKEAKKLRRTHQTLTPSKACAGCLASYFIPRAARKARPLPVRAPPRGIYYTRQFWKPSFGAWERE